MDTGWTLLSNHGHVLVALARDPDARVRDIAQAVGVTERTVQGILRDLVDAGYVDRVRRGRRNHYDLHPELPMRHPLEQGQAVGQLLEVLAAPDDESASVPPA